MRPKPLILIILIFAVLFAANLVFAREMEVSLPQMSSLNLPLLPDYVKYIFNFAVGIAGFIAFCCLIYGGARYVFSAGNPTAMADANDQIFAGIIGLVVVLGSWLLLITVNPQLVILKFSREPTPPIEETIGVYLCENVGGTGCQVFTSSAALGDFGKDVKLIKFKNPDNNAYGAVLHGVQTLAGGEQLFYCLVVLEDTQIQPENYYSVDIFIRTSSAGGRVALCEHTNCRKTNPGDAEEAKRVFTFDEGDAVPNPPGASARGFSCFNCGGRYKYDNGDIIDGGLFVPVPNFWDAYDRGVSALEVENSTAILFDEENYDGVCELFQTGDPALGSGNDIGDDRASSMMIIR